VELIFTTEEVKLIQTSKTLPQKRLKMSQDLQPYFRGNPQTKYQTLLLNSLKYGGFTLCALYEIKVRNWY
tara:strand:+ start:2289 stop:2498 length:210 start_codon:yes stop_codon:yes gene_type:complete